MINQNPKIEINIKEKTISFIAEKLDLNPSDINESTSFYSDLCINSMRALELLCDVEDRFNFDIPDEDLAIFQKVGDLIEYLEKNLYRA